MIDQALALVRTDCAYLICTDQLQYAHKSGLIYIQGIASQSFFALFYFAHITFQVPNITASKTAIFVCILSFLANSLLIFSA